MALERLIKNETQENLAPSRVLAIDPSGVKIQIQVRDTTCWAACDSSQAATIKVGDEILVGRSGDSYYLVGKYHKILPTQTTLLEV